ncbi:MAG: hypothetical protein AAFO74_14100 [Pseudomonadota bacterium]
MKHSETQTNNPIFAGIVLWIVAGIFVLAGLGTMVVDRQPSAGVAHAGILLGATGSSGAKGLHNNTTLRIQRFNGKIESLEVRSSVRMSDIPKIRKQANQHVGERVVYYRRDRDFGRLISMRTVAGETIVSAAHTRAAQTFTAWGMLLSGLVIGVGALLVVRGPRRSRSDAA